MATVSALPLPVPQIVSLWLDGSDPALTLELPQSLLLLNRPPAQAAPLAAAFRAAFPNAAEPAILSVTDAPKWSLVASGPLLDGPDQAQVASTVREKENLVITVAYTNARLSGASFRRNRQWRPLLVIPVPAASGNFHYRVIWNGPPVPNQPQIIQTLTFQVKP